MDELLDEQLIEECEEACMTAERVLKPRRPSQSTKLKKLLKCLAGEFYIGKAPDFCKGCPNKPACDELVKAIWKVKHKYFATEGYKGIV